MLKSIYLFTYLLIYNCRAVLSRAVTYAQLTSRGPVLAGQGLLLYYAQIVGDYERVVAQLVAEGRHADAVATLSEASFENGTCLSLLRALLLGF